MSVLNDGIDIGSPIVTPSINFPKEEYERLREGWVLVQADLGLRGELTNIVVKSYSPSESFVPPAIEYASKVRYAPYKENGRLVILERHFFLVKFLLKKRSGTSSAPGQSR
ncbi:TonB-like protein [Alteromonadaceae bacterium 2753L.S.0a.02]|nr:TonB-like protein [Alteromonadaceae bacterium 2753L.S.0a.02]